MNPLNLDKLAAKYSQKMVEEASKVPGVNKPIDALERLATKTLGVLQEQGIYAMLLFLASRSSDEEEIAPKICEQLFALLGELPGLEEKEGRPRAGDECKQALPFYSDHILDDLDTLLLVRDLYEQTLIYARFGAKAAKEEQTS